jgi:hypothetical protein
MSDEDEDEDEEDEIQEELGYMSPLDNVDPYITFKQALAGACTRLEGDTGFAYTPFSFPNEESARVPGCDERAEYRPAKFLSGADGEGR